MVQEWTASMVFAVDAFMNRAGASSRALEVEVEASSTHAGTDSMIWMKMLL